MPSILSRPSSFDRWVPHLDTAPLLAHSRELIGWLVFLFIFQINLRNAGIFLDDACLLYSLDTAIPQYNEGINEVSFILVIFYIFYCYMYWEEECRSLYRELRYYRNSLYGGSIVQATAANMQTAICVVLMRFGPFSFLKISMHLSLGVALLPWLPSHKKQSSKSHLFVQKR